MDLKKIEKVLTSKSVGTGPSSYEKKNLPGRGLTKVEKHCIRGPKQTLKATNDRQFTQDGINSVVGKMGLFMCRIASLFLLQRLKGSMSGDARDFNNIETRAVIKIFFFFFRARQGAEGNSRHSDRNIK